MLRMIEYLSACLASSGSSSPIRIPSTLVGDRACSAGRSSRSRRPAWDRRCRGGTGRPTSRSGSPTWLWPAVAAAGGRGPSRSASSSPAAPTARGAAPRAGRSACAAETCRPQPAPIVSCSCCTRCCCSLRVRCTLADRHASSLDRSRRLSRSMPVQELRAVDQCPGQIDHGLRAVRLAGLRVLSHDLQLLVGREAREDRQVERVDDLARIRLGPDQLLAACGPARSCAGCGSNSAGAAAGRPWGGCCAPIPGRCRAAGGRTSPGTGW